MTPLPDPPTADRSGHPEPPGGPALPRVPPELLVEVCRSTGLPPNIAARVLDDVLAYFHETAPEYVRRRHRELQRRGHGNDRIFEQLSAELPALRFAAEPLSQRQLRRIVYG